MRHIGFTNRLSVIAVVSSVGVGCLGTSSASAIPIALDGIAESLAINMQVTPLYNGDFGAPANTWNIPSAPAKDGSIVDTDGSSALVYHISRTGFDPAGSLSWTGNPLTGGSNPGGEVTAQFGAGGSFSLSGRVRNNFFAPIFTGVLLTGTITGFEIIEPSNDDFIDLSVIPVLTVTGGALANGTIPGMQLVGDYRIGFSGAKANQLSGGLNNLDEDIFSVQASLFNLSRIIPEPATLSLLGIGAALVAVRTRRRG